MPTPGRCLLIPSTLDYAPDWVKDRPGTSISREAFESLVGVTWPFRFRQ
jgi:hypothetical protein